MIVRDRLTNLFKTIDNLQLSSTDNIFNFVDSELLDKYYINMYGNRVVTPIVENLTIEELSEILSNKYIRKWNSIMLNYLDSENILDNYKEVLTETNDDNLVNENTRTDTTKVSAYNDDDFVNKDEDLTVENINIENTRNKNITRTKIKEADFYNKVNEYLTNFDIYNTMVIDINSVVTLSILN